MQINFKLMTCVIFTFDLNLWHLLKIYPQFVYMFKAPCFYHFEVLVVAVGR